MASPIIIPSFMTGELSPQMWGRVDLAKYHAGAKWMRNLFVEYRGGASNRPGSQFMGRAFDSARPVRLIPFQFSTLQTYCLEFGNNYMRVIANFTDQSTGAGYVLEPSKAITLVNPVNPLSVHVPGHGFSNGDWVYVTGVNGTSQINGKTFVVEGVLGDDFRLTDYNTNNIDASGWSGYISGGTIARVYTLATPYAASDLSLLKYTQSADTMTLTHPSYDPYALTRTQHWAWTIVVVNFAPSTTPPVATSATPSSAGTTTYKYVVTAIGANGVTESAASNVVSGASAVMSTTAGAKVTVAWNTVAGATGYNVYRTQEYQATTPPAGALFGFVGATDNTGVSFIDENIIPDFTQCPPIANNPFAGGNHPGCSAYFQGRQVYGGGALNPLGVWFSKSADFRNMSYSTPARADDAITDTLTSNQVNAVKHLIPLTSLIALTSAGAFRIDGGTQSDVITPASLLAVPQATNGASDVPPLQVNYDVLYVQAKGSLVRDLHLINSFTNIYVGDDLSTLSSHLFFGHQILEWCWAEEPYRLVQAVREDGVMLVMAYLKEQEIFGWSHFDTAGQYKSVCSISEGDEDAVYQVVYRKINGEFVQLIERQASRNFNNRVEEAWFVDSGLQTKQFYSSSISLTPVNFVEKPNDELTGVVYGGGANISSVTIPFGGTGYTAPTITANDPTGSGATFTAVLTAGVITGVIVNTQGSGYTDTSLIVSDPTGRAAVLHANITNYEVIASSAALFNPSTVGAVLRLSNGILDIIAVAADQKSATVNVRQPLSSKFPVVPGNWSISNNVTQVSGLEHLLGETVAILADGSVQLPQVVRQLSPGVVGITLDTAASWVTVGLPYTGQLKTLTPELPGMATVQGARQTFAGLTVRAYNTRGLNVGPTFAEMFPFRERTDELMGQPTDLLTGDERTVISPAWQAPGQMCFQENDPLPMTITAIIPDISTGDDAG